MAEGEVINPLPFGRAIAALSRCAARALPLIVKGRIHQPRGRVGQVVCFSDRTSAKIYRETTVDGVELSSPAVLVVRFRLRRVRTRWAHALFRLESELNTVLFVGFAGFKSKLWFGQDQQGVYRGVYQWDDPDLAVTYVRALWWALAAVSDPESIRYALLPGRYRDEMLDLVADEMNDQAGGWWQPVRTQDADEIAATLL